MIIRMKKYIYIASLVFLSACSDNDNIIDERIDDSTCRPADPSCLISSVEDYIDVAENGTEMPATRANMLGTSFEPGDMMRLRITAPFVDYTEYGESTWSGSYDNWRLFEWHSADEDNNPAKTGRWYYLGYTFGSSTSKHSSEFDINNDYYPSNAPGDIYMPQATPYVFTATTWTEEIRHIIPKANAGGTSILSFSNVFKADQRRAENYKSSDVLWAQSYVETGSENVFLNFQHKMAALIVTVDPTHFHFYNSNNAEELVLTLENMPDIDQQEVVIGNGYYKNTSNYNGNYKDMQRSGCDKADNGKVLGICYVNQSEGKIERKAFTALNQTGIYTAYRVTSTSDYTGFTDGAIQFMLIIPPYTVPLGITPTLCLRQGHDRWKAELPLTSNRTFESGKRYSVTMKK